jgi:hypothetical protein
MALKAIAKRAPVVLTVQLILTTHAVDQNVFIADRDYTIESIAESHITADTDAGTVSIDVKKASGTTAIASGTSVLGSVFNAKSTANTPVSKTKANGGLVSTASTNILEAGSRLGLDFTGITDYAGGTVTIVLSPVNGVS